MPCGCSTSILRLTWKIRIKNGEGLAEINIVTFKQTISCYSAGLMAMVGAVPRALTTFNCFSLMIYGLVLIRLWQIPSCATQNIGIRFTASLLLYPTMSLFELFTDKATLSYFIRPTRSLGSWSFTTSFCLSRING